MMNKDELEFLRLVKERDQAREHYDRIEQKCHETEMELKETFKKIEVLSMDNDALISERDHNYLIAEKFKKERDVAQSEVTRLKARIEIQEGISRDLLLQRGELLADLNALKAERDLSQQINCASDHKEALLEAEDKIEELKDQRDRWFNMAQNESENHMRVLAELKQLKDHIPGVTKMIKPEPSRLEIAAMFKSAWFANSDYKSEDACDDGWWIEQADKLIEANKK